MPRPIIGITTNLLYRSIGTVDGKFATNNNQEYDLAIFRAGGQPVLLPSTSNPHIIEEQIALCDGILLAGGDDINPLLYGEEPHKYLGETNYDVDLHHLTLAKLTLKAKKPILGICRGMQLLNIACGGNVYQDLSEFPIDRLQHTQIAPRTHHCHTITTDSSSLLASILGTCFSTNSFHHQSIHRLGQNVLSTAWAKDRTIEAIELTDYPFALGVQWHPEIMLKKDDTMLPLFQAFLEACRSSQVIC